MEQEEQGQSRVTGTRGTNTAPSATAVRGTAGPKPLPLLPKLFLFSHKEEGWEHSQKHAEEGRV